MLTLGLVFALYINTQLHPIVLVYNQHYSPIVLHYNTHYTVYRVQFISLGEIKPGK